MTRLPFFNRPNISPRAAVEALERAAPLPDGPGERFSGYSVISLSFRSDHVLALRRFTASSIGPGYTSVWHRDPAGHWTFYSTIAPDVSCARYFGQQVERNVVSPIGITWENDRQFRVVIGTAFDWRVTLRASLPTRLLNAAAGAIPERAWQVPAVLRLIAMAANATLGVGRMNLTGLTPNGQRFIANPRRVWLIDESEAVVEGVALGPVVRTRRQASLGDLLLPRKGLFAIARARFERPVNRGTPRASRVGSRVDLGAGPGKEVRKASATQSTVNDSFWRM